MSALDDKDVPSAEQWQSAVKFMTSAVQKEIKSAEESLDKLVGPKSFYDRWLRWRSQSEAEGKRQAISEELTKFLNAEPVSLLLRTYLVLVARVARCEEEEKSLSGLKSPSDPRNPL